MEGQNLHPPKALVLWVLFAFIFPLVVYAQTFEPEAIRMLNLKKDLQAQYDAKKNVDAEKQIHRLTDYYRRDGEILFLSGQVYYHLEKWGQAIAYFSQSVEAGYRTAESAYNIACSYARNDQPEEALMWLQKSIDEYPSFYYSWMEDSDLASLANDPAYLHELFAYNRNASNREEKWQADIAFFNERMIQFHYDLFKNIELEDWNMRVKNLKKAVAGMEDYQIIVELMKMAALAGDGHTVVVPPVQAALAFHRAPFLTKVFDDGLYIIEARTDYQHLLGEEVMAINDIPIGELMEKVERVIPHDNKFGIKWMLPLALSIPEILSALELTDHKLEYEITTRKNGQIAQHQIISDITLEADFLESWLYGFHDTEGWVELERKKIPSSSTRRDKPYWFEYLEKQQMVVFYYNQVKTDQRENEEAFMQRLNRFIEANDVRALVIDLRSNEGGDNTVYRPILNGIISNLKVNQPGKLFTLIGRRTFSAGMCFATELEKSTHAIFVGEPTGSSPNFVGESGGVFQLPYSGIYVNASNLFWQNSYAFDTRKFIAPDIHVSELFAGYRQGIDKPLEAIKYYLTNK